MEQWNTFMIYRGIEIQIKGSQYRINDPRFNPGTRRFEPIMALDAIDAVIKQS
ncbi:hypothetical protein [Paenibacillus sp. FSL L8-0708]|uniref:hypothetical protein n=1 Tax=Paenibacillus sp. FSL L8-0708 TaxID=2975311 RepID=UPI0030FB557A